MPITVSVLTSGGNGTSALSYNTAQVNPGPLSLIEVEVFCQLGAGGPPTPTVSGNGLTYVQMATIATSAWRLTIFRAMGVVPTNGPLTISFTTAPDGITWIVKQWTGVDQSGSNGSGAVLNPTTASVIASSITITLPAFADSHNRPTGVFGRNAVANITPGTGFTELNEVNALSMTLQTEWRDAVDTTVDASAGSASFRWYAVAYEVVAGPSNRGWLWNRGGWW